MNTLNCSKNGDKRYSEFYAKVKVSDKIDTIFNHMQLCKRFLVNGKTFIPKTPEDCINKKPIYFVVNNIEIPMEYINQFYQLLWIRYLSNHQNLVKHALKFENILDIPETENSNAKIEIIKTFVIEGREIALEKCEPLLRLLKQNYITEIIGDIFHSKKDIIVQQVNCKGITKGYMLEKIKDIFPEAYEDYYYFCKQCNFSRYNMGMCQIVETSRNSKRYVANLFAQENCEGKEILTEYNYFKKALIKLKEEAKNKNLSIAIPYKIGCEYEGGSWDLIMEIIKDVFNDFPVTIYKKND